MIEVGDKIKIIKVDSFYKHYGILVGQEYIVEKVDIPFFHKNILIRKHNVLLGFNESEVEVIK